MREYASIESARIAWQSVGAGTDEELSPRMAAESAVP